MIISTNTIVYMLVSYTVILILVKIFFLYHKYHVIIMNDIPIYVKLHTAIISMRKRVYYKLLLLTYKTLNGSAPEYLLNQSQDYCPTRVLRFGDQNLLSVKRTRMKIGDSSFAVAASILWNALPCQIKKARTIDCFKSMVKTHLFKL